jgi:hypothetical protein
LAKSAGHSLQSDTNVSMPFGLAFCKDRKVADLPKSLKPLATCVLEASLMLSFGTTTPYGLLAEIKKAIDDKKVTTWSYDKDGDFTHTPEQWKAKAWFRPRIVDGSELRFVIIRPQNANVSDEVYAIYHGRFIEMMLAHFNTKFGSGVASALPTATDNSKAA